MTPKRGEGAADGLVAVKTKIDGKVVSIDFYTWATMPGPLREEAKRRGFKVE